MTLTHLREWAIFYDLEPPLDERIGWLFASLETSILNPQRDKKKRPTPFSAAEFYRHFGDEHGPRAATKQDWNAKKARLKEVAATMKAQKLARQMREEQRKVKVKPVRTTSRKGS